jgi:hypothetical protein
MFRLRTVRAQHRRQVNRVFPVEPIGAGICAAPQEQASTAGADKTL